MKTWEDLWAMYTKQPDMFLEEVFVVVSGQQLERLPTDPAVNWMRRDWSLRSSGVEHFRDGAGLTLWEEVEQCNAFLSRIAVTTKHMSKPGRTDMLTLMAMRWNQLKLDNLATSLTRRYQKATKALQTQLQNLESLRIEFSVCDSQLGDWVSDVKEWAEAATTSITDEDSVVGRIEVLVASIKTRSQRLYKDTDGNKARAKIRHKIREEKGILTLAVEKYNRLVPNTEILCLEEILSGDPVWPWQQPHSDSVCLTIKRRAFDGIMAVRRLEEEKRILVREMDHHWKSLLAYEDTLKKLSYLSSSGSFKSSSCPLTDEGLKGLQNIILREREQMMMSSTATQNAQMMVCNQHL
ncbi:uncharacterized protein LOC124878915 isoform X3 [Girardinichthys multiradiatus]|uniref:uncharacterized protein LOC124878915 isoform X3 n=1 Tax=Girardinichthys multiradiatus TaxID=208333 RepID=UPI001FAC75CF|nr:uncharacterized protein LOC124878915 isoform X3 [Girardinichthys multiradiatus]